MKHNYEFELGDLIYVTRKLNNLTQVEFSKQLGVVQSTVSKVEKHFFDDVPFSFVSKVSTLFNIPLSHFQVGLLPIKNQNLFKNIISEKYIKGGFINSKTIFYLLEQISLYKNNIYKEIKLPKQYLCLSQLNFNQSFIEMLVKKYPKEVAKALKELKLKKTSEADVSTPILEKYIGQSKKAISIVSSKFDQNSGILKINFDPNQEYNSSLYDSLAQIMLLEFSIVLGTTSSNIKSASESVIEFEFTY